MICAAIFLLGIILPGCATQPDLSTERIVSFHSEIWVQPNESLLVIETITVVRTGERIHSGIYKVFPRKDLVSPPRYVVDEVLRNGKQENFYVARPQDGHITELYIGPNVSPAGFGSRTGVSIEDGLHEYKITYRTNWPLESLGHTNSGAKRGLYWSVTGNWPFVIEKAFAILHLRNGDELVDAASEGGAARARMARDSVEFETTTVLAEQENMAITASWIAPAIQGQ